jgi:uncharacterized membrane protein
VNEQQELPKPKPRLGTGFLLGIIAIVATIVISIAIGWWGWPSRYIGGWTWWSIFMILMGGLIAVVLAGTRALREFITRYREQRFISA